MTQAKLPEPPIIRAEEPTPVQLTRMEGILNLISERLGTVQQRVDGHDRDISELNKGHAELRSETQTLREQAEADKATAVALALALKEADENRRKKAESSWSPWSKALAVVAAIFMIWQVLSPFVLPK
jgi:chromosome segregation ATPase